MKNLGLPGVPLARVSMREALEQLLEAVEGYPLPLGSHDAGAIIRALEDAREILGLKSRALDPKPFRRTRLYP